MESAKLLARPFACKTYGPALYYCLLMVTDHDRRPYTRHAVYYDEAWDAPAGREYCKKARKQEVSGSTAQNSAGN